MIRFPRSKPKNAHVMALLTLFACLGGCAGGPAGPAKPPPAESEIDPVLPRDIDASAPEEEDRTEHEAGEPLSALDAGSESESDAAPEQESGRELDASSPSSSAEDAALHADAGSPIDAAPAMHVDAGRPAADAASSTSRYTTDVAPIVARHCLGCHIPGGAGPFPLTNYGEVSELAEVIQFATSDRVMPPCEAPAEPCGMSEQEIETIRRWVAQGAQR
jgi:mono/diheme cytochrome c family protein